MYWKKIALWGLAFAVADYFLFRSRFPGQEIAIGYPASVPPTWLPGAGVVALATPRPDAYRAVPVTGPQSTGAGTPTLLAPQLFNQSALPIGTRPRLVPLPTAGLSQILRRS